MNKVQLIGWLGKDPVVKTASNGCVYANLQLATDLFYKNGHGAMVKKTCWHTVRIWNKEQVEKLGSYLVKGSHVLVEGVIDYRDYTDDRGLRVCVTEIRASALIDLDR